MMRMHGYKHITFLMHHSGVTFNCHQPLKLFIAIVLINKGRNKYRTAACDNNKKKQNFTANHNNLIGRDTIAPITIENKYI